MMESLNRQNHPRPQRPVRILQFGEGFLRAPLSMISFLS